MPLNSARWLVVGLILTSGGNLGENPSNRIQNVLGSVIPRVTKALKSGLFQFNVFGLNWVLRCTIVQLSLLFPSFERHMNRHMNSVANVRIALCAFGLDDIHMPALLSSSL